MTIAIAFDRYLVISRPRTARHYCTTKKARLLALLVISFALIYNIPRWFEYYTYTKEEEEEDQVRYEMIISELRMNQEYRRFYIFWAYLFTMFVLPSTFLTIINFLIWKGVRTILTLRKHRESKTKFISASSH